MRTNFYNKKRVLVTGHTGFVGSWLSLQLVESGADIIGVSLKPPSNPYHYKYLKLDNNLKSIRGDVRSLTFLRNLIKDYEPEIIFHLAAQPILLDSYSNPVDTYTTNIIGTLNILEAARIAGNTKTVVCITSDKVYENIGVKKLYTEKDKLGGFDPYSSSKAAAELIANAYRNSFLSGIGVATARSGNIIGGGGIGVRID